MCSIGEALRAYFDPEYLKMPAIPEVVPAALLAWFNLPEGKWFGKEIDEDNTPDADMRQGFDRGPIRRVRQVVGYLAARNANFLFGTDTPSAPTYGNLPGLNGYLEMQQLRDTESRVDGMPLLSSWQTGTLFQGAFISFRGTIS